MSIQVSKKVNKFKTSLPKKGAFTIETEPDFPKLHTLCIASGKRGGGKSIATANFIVKRKSVHHLETEHYKPPIPARFSEGNVPIKIR